MMAASCIDVSPDDFSPQKIYQVKTLDMDGNTGIYGTKDVILQGSSLRNRLDPDCRLLEILSAEELEIQVDLFYSVANFHDRLPSYEPIDERVIPVGNWEHIVTGKALLELTAEGTHFPHIRLASGEVGPTYETALVNLTKLANGARRFMIGGDKTDYQEALQRLNLEYQRAGGIIRTPDTSAHQKQRGASFHDLVNSAKQRQALQAETTANHTQAIMTDLERS